MSGSDNEDERNTIPKTSVIRELLSPITLRELFEKDESDIYMHFDYEKRKSDTLLYSIPEHQRYPQWNKEKKEMLIDSIFCGYTITGVILSEHIRNGKKMYDIEDGQTRLSILQMYHDNTFKFNGYKFYELSNTDQNRFLNYKISREVLSPVSGNANDFQEDIHHIFERLQMGKPLSNADLYWNRSDTKLVVCANTLIEKYKNIENNYLGIKNYSSKKRSVLPEFCALITSIINDDNLADIYGPAFRFQNKYINDEITTEQFKKIIDFMNYYTHIIITAESHPIESPNKQSYNKCAKFWGCIVMDWKNTNEVNTLKKQKDKWIEIIKISRASPNFIKGAQTLYNGMAKGCKQNTTTEANRSRLQRINDFYYNKDHFTSEYGIKWINP